MRTVTFFVEGTPVPQGSVTGHVAKRKDGTRFATIHYRSGSKLMQWRNAVAKGARREWGESAMIFDAIALDLTFYMPRPLRHYTLTGIRVGYVSARHEGVPDLDKLVRAILDALTEVVYGDDAQVNYIRARKMYVADRLAPPGVQVTISDALPK